MGFVELMKFVTIHTPDRPLRASSVDMGAGLAGADATGGLAIAGDGEPFAGGVAQAAVAANSRAETLHVIAVLISALG